MGDFVFSCPKMETITSQMNMQKLCALVIIQSIILVVFLYSFIHLIIASSAFNVINKYDTQCST